MAVASLALAALAIACGLMPPEEEAAPAAPSTPENPGPPGPLPPPGYQLVFEDDFVGTTLDTRKWTALAEIRRDALSTPEAIRVSGGVLTVTTYTQGGLHRTGFLITEGKFMARYGYFEARIRFNDSPGGWCAFWLNAPTIGKPQGDPGTAGVEIDVVEHRVTDEGGWDALADMVAMNLNWDGPNWKNDQRVVALPSGSKVQGEWHTYGVVWTAGGYTFYVDGAALWTVASPISNRTQDVRLTCEVEDASWAGFIPPGGYGSLALSKTRMEVDWVRVWQPAP